MSDLVQTKKAMMTADSGETLNEEVVPAETEEAATAEEDRSPVTVLLVDDDASFLDYVRGELKEYHVVTANSGNDAWGQLLVSAPDVVVTDVKMPNGDGYELCHRIKRNIDTENIPVIVLTSESTQQSAEQAMECEADRFLSKPLNVTLLRGAIEQSLKVRRNILSRARRSDVGFEYNQVQMESADSKLMQHVMDSIRRHLSDSDFNVEQLSREVGISRVHLNRKMKELLGTSPSTLIRSVRLKQAAFLLIDNDVTVSEIAYSVGFSSPSYFTSNFTSYFGMTPKAFVQNYLKNPNDEKLKKLLE
jgi:YesN/AraC family two-component response regulator